jgi:RND family efflux transporter MFP subunit
MPDKSHDADILRHRTPPRLKLTGIVALGAAIVIAVAGIAWRLHNDTQTASWTGDQTVFSVQVLKLKGAKAGGDLSLPGDVQAFTNAPIYSQVAGFVKKWNFDIGAPVKAGAVLAEIDPRSFQAALDQAHGQLARDSATLANAKVDLARYQSLAAQNAISNQTLSAAQTTVNADSGIVQADQAAVATAGINLGYTRVLAPFDGIVTSRSVDVGTLVTVGTATSTTPLFTVTDRTKLRIYVHVPQVYSGMLKPGLTADFTVTEYPGRKFNAVLAASAGAMSSANGTQLVQFVIDNKDGALKPGDYANVHLKLPAGKGNVRLPATALLFRDEGMMVATVDASNHVHLKPISIGSDMGNVVDINGGITLKDRIIDNPPDSIENGDPVRVITAAPAPASAN